MKHARLYNDRNTLYECMAQVRDGVILVGIRPGEILVFWLEGETDHPPPAVSVATDRINDEHFGSPFERAHAMLDAAIEACR